MMFNLYLSFIFMQIMCMFIIYISILLNSSFFPNHVYLFTFVTSFSIFKSSRVWGQVLTNPKQDLDHWTASPDSTSTFEMTVSKLFFF